jgi:2,4-dienoyl-CoA reductase-like NADH-dependent reductase (Old Yellow Enzyme family)
VVLRGEAPYEIKIKLTMLFEPFNLHGLRLKNRIVRSATYEKRADDDGYVTESYIELYEELARGGSGLLITGFTLVDPRGRAAVKMACLHSDRYIEGFRRVTDRVHEGGGLIAVQLVHGGRQSPPLLLGGAMPLAPSAVTDTSSGVTPREMTDQEIWEAIEAFGEAAKRAEEAGFDALQIHGAHGYLISSFLSPYANRRDDYWGGDTVRRFHFLEEVYRAVRKAVGATYPVLIKLNGDDLLPEGGLKPEESLKIAKRLEELGINGIEISGGMKESPIRTIRPGILRPSQEAYFRDIGELFKKNLKVPIILTGGMRTRKVMEDVLRKREADLIGLSRPLLREPDLPNKIKETGKEKADCISCNKCTNYLELEKVECVQKNH